MRMVGWIIGLLIVNVARAESWRPSELFLSAVRFVESSNGKFLTGDDGQSLGDFQISEAAWADVNAWRRARRLPVLSYDTHVFNRKINRLYAADYFSILRAELKGKLKRDPSSAELYAAYNMGMTEFAQCNYRLAQVNPVTQRKCRQINEILRGKVPAEMASPPKRAR